VPRSIDGRLLFLSGEDPLEKTEECSLSWEHFLEKVVEEKCFPLCVYPRGFSPKRKKGILLLKESE